MTVSRPATAADAVAVAALEAVLFGADAWTPGQVVEELTGPGRSARVAAVANGVDGYVVLRAAGDAVDLQRIGVRPERQRRGLAGALLAEALAGLPGAEGATVLLEVSEANTAGRAFYARAGFTEIGRRRRYYRDGTDAVVMQRPPRREAW